MFDVIRLSSASVLLTAVAEASEQMIETEDRLAPALEDVVTIPPSLSREDHYCSRWTDPCDHDSQYFNWLSCQCFASYQCEIGCMPGYELDPRFVCGECLSSEKIREKIFPSWATDKDIEYAADVGIQLNDARPDDWRVCPVAKRCAANQYWDELACQCFYDVPCQCPVDMQSDPATECGACIDFKTVREKYYPKWATPHDISLATLDGLSKKWEKDQRQICPFD